MGTHDPRESLACHILDLGIFNGQRDGPELPSIWGLRIPIKSPDVQEMEFSLSFSVAIPFLLLVPILPIG